MNLAQLLVNNVVCMSAASSERLELMLFSPLLRSRILSAPYSWCECHPNYAHQVNLESSL